LPRNLLRQTRFFKKKSHLKIKAEHIADFTGHRDAVYALRKGERAGTFFSAGADGMIIQWTGAENPGEVVARLPAAVYSLLYLSQENVLIAGTRFGTLYFLDLNSKKVKEQISLSGDIFSLARIDNLMVAATSKGLYFINWENSEILSQLQPTEKSCREVVISTDKKTIATGWSDNFIRIYNVEARLEILSFKAHENSVFSLAYLAHYLISGSRDAGLKVWNTETHYALEETLAAHWFTVNAIAVSPDKKHFASGSRDKSVKIWSAPPSVKLLKVLERPNFSGHTHSVNCLLWLDEDTLISAGDDKTIKEWKIYEGE
jgi:WD repeat-containing protein 61